MDVTLLMTKNFSSPFSMDTGTLNTLELSLDEVVTWKTSDFFFSFLLDNQRFLEPKVYHSLKDSDTLFSHFCQVDGDVKRTLTFTRYSLTHFSDYSRSSITDTSKPSETSPQGIPELRLGPESLYVCSLVLWWKDSLDFVIILYLHGVSRESPVSPQDQEDQCPILITTRLR